MELGTIVRCQGKVRAMSEALTSIVNFSAAMTKYACLPPTSERLRYDSDWWT
jgi:hypothetical protein